MFGHRINNLSPLERERIAKSRKSKYEVPEDVKAQRQKLNAEREAAVDRARERAAEQDRVRQHPYEVVRELIMKLGPDDTRKILDAAYYCDGTQLRNALMELRNGILNPPASMPVDPEPKPVTKNRSKPAA